MVGPVKLLLVDDHDALIEGLRIFLEEEEDLAVVGVARNGGTGLRVVRGAAPEILLLDLHAAPPDPAVAIADVKADAPASNILALSAATTRPGQDALAGNADAFVLKDASSRQLVATIRKLIGGHDVFVSYAAPSPPKPDPSIQLLVRTLSPRERDVLELITAGYSNRRIAETCYLSLHTVRTHVQNILVKLGVHSKLEAAVFAVQHGLVPLNPDGTPRCPAKPTVAVHA